MLAPCVALDGAGASCDAGSGGRGELLVYMVRVARQCADLAGDGARAGAGSSLTLIHSNAAADLLVFFPGDGELNPMGVLQNQVLLPRGIERDLGR